MSDSNQPKFISVGLDVGSQNVRLFISQQNSSQPLSVVPNEIGQRYSLAISTPEPDLESDPMNDQYWDDKKKKKNDSSKTKEIHYLYGDAARKSLEREKKPIAPHTILNMVQIQEEENEDEQTDALDTKAACASFFQHMTNLTSHVTHTNPQSLRFVFCTSPDESGSSSLSNLSSAIQQGILKSIDQEGYKKAEKKQIYQEKRIISIITHPVAIAHAHKLFEHGSKRNVLVVDWGASALALSHLSITAGMAQIQQHKSESSLSGNNIVLLLVKHIAELFERKNRGVPPGEVLSNKKSRAKLLVAAEDALRSFGYSPKVTITIDGLFEGMDCHVDVMLARFEMLMGNILRSAEGKLKDIQGSDEAFDVVIGAGSIMRMKCVEKMMNRLFPKEQVGRGENANDVPPEEAAAMGCALYGSKYLSSDYLMEEEENDCEAEECNLVDEEVHLSPIGIGLSLVESDPAAIVLIEKGTPLPALVTKIVDVTGCSANSLDIVQINDGEKVIGRMEGVGDNGAKEIEVTIELSASGELSVAVNGGSAVTF